MVVSQPLLTSKLRLYDTCGVHNLHGIPAILSAIFSSYFASMATVDNYKDSLTDIFPARYLSNSTYALEHNATVIVGVSIFSYRLLLLLLLLFITIYSTSEELLCTQLNLKSIYELMRKIYIHIFRDSDVQQMNKLDIKR